MIEPGRVFDRVTDLDEVPDCYCAMHERETIKASVPGPNYYGGLHQREKDDRGQ